MSADDTARRRGDAPAPAEPPAVELPTRWSTLDDAMRVAHERPLISTCTWHSRSECVCPVHDVVGRLSDAGMLRDAAPAAHAEPPAVELPVTLSSVDDVAAVCLAHGLTVRSSGPGWTQWRDPDTKAVVHCEAWQSGVERVTVAGRDRADIYRPVARGTLVAAIEAAWGGSR